MKNKWVREKLYPIAIKQEWIRLLISAYVELIIASYISFYYFKLDEWNKWDKFAVICHIIGLIVAFVFFFFILWFVWYKSTLLLTKIKLEREEHFKSKMKEASEKIKLFYRNS